MHSTFYLYLSQGNCVMKSDIHLITVPLITLKLNNIVKACKTMKSSYVSSSRLGDEHSFVQL